MRSLKELLEIVLVNESNMYYSGLCKLVHELHCKDLIGLDEYLKLDLYIEQNRPKWYSSISAFFCHMEDNQFYWPKYDRKPRIKWLKKHIKLNS